MMTSLRLPRLAGALTVWNGLCLAAAVVAAVLMTQQNAGVIATRVQEDNALRAGRAVSMAFAKAMEREWESLRAVAAKLGTMDYTTARGFMDAVPDASASVTWAGLADTSGRILAGSQGVRDGEDVSDRRWFREGLKKENAGSVFAPSDSAGRSYVNLSIPVRADDGRVVGVLVYRIAMAWVDRFVTDTAAALEADAMVLNGAGQVVTRALETYPGDPTPAELRATELKMDRGLVLEGRESPDFISASVNNFAGTNVPHMGWSLVVRVAPQSAASGSTPETRSTSLMLALAIAAIFAAMAIVNRVFARPLEALANCAASFAKGEIRHPVEWVNSREADQLSSSLAFLQTKLQPRKKTSTSPAEPATS